VAGFVGQERLGVQGCHRGNCFLSHSPLSETRTQRLVVLCGWQEEKKREQELLAALASCRSDIKEKDVSPQSGASFSR
jgi:hypothetical protein